MYIYLNIKQKNRSHPSLDHRITTAAPLTSGVAGLLQQPPAQAGVGQAAAREDGERDGALLGLPAVPSRAAEEDRREDGAEGGARTQPRVSPFALPHPRGRSLFRGSSTTTTCTAYGFIFSRGRAHHFHHHHTSHHRQQHSRYQS